MKKTIHQSLLCLIFLMTGIYQDTFAQSWQKTTLNFAPDTVVSSAIVCDYDNAGTKYFAGYYYDIVNFDDGIFLWKVNSAGTITGKVKLTTNSSLWITQSVKAVKFISGALYVAVDAKYQSGILDMDAFIMKFNTNLVKQWERFQNRTGDPNDFGISIEAGPNTSVIFAGNSGTQGFINKYSRADGTTMASNVIDPGVGAGTATVVKLIVNGSFIFVGGNYSNSTANIYVQRYDGLLVKKWSNIFDPSGNASNSYFYDMALDTAGNPGVCGYYKYTSSINRAFITKYSKSTGNTPWTKKISIDYSEGRGISADAAGNYICILEASPFPRFYKFNNSNGAVLTHKSIFNNQMVEFVPYKLVKGAAGSTYVMGRYDSTYFDGSWHPEAGVIISKLNDSGNREWNHKFTSTRADWWRTMGDFGVYNNTTVIYSVDEQDVSLIPKEYYATYGCFSATTGLRTGDDNHLPDAGKLNIYPNPATDQISFIPTCNDENAIIEIIDAAGRMIQSENSALSKQQPYDISIGTLTQGYYLIKVTTTNGISIEKFLKQ